MVWTPDLGHIIMLKAVASNEFIALITILLSEDRTPHDVFFSCVRWDGGGGIPRWVVVVVVDGPPSPPPLPPPAPPHHGNCDVHEIVK